MDAKKIDLPKTCETSLEISTMETYLKGDFTNIVHTVQELLEKQPATSSSEDLEKRLKTTLHKSIDTMSLIYTELCMLTRAQMYKFIETHIIGPMRLPVHETSFVVEYTVGKSKKVKSTKIDATGQTRRNLEQIKDYDFSMELAVANEVEEAKKNGRKYNPKKNPITIKESYLMITTKYANMQNSRARYSGVTCVKGRVKGPPRVSEKAIHTGFKIDDWYDEFLESQEGKISQRKEKEGIGEIVSSLRGIDSPYKDVIADISAMRVFVKTKKDIDLVMGNIGRQFGQTYQEYSIDETGRPKKDDRLEDESLPGIVWIKDYLEGKGEKKIYKALHACIRYCGRLMELQVLTEEMHQDNEEKASHTTYAQKQEYQRKKFLEHNPELKPVVETVNRLFKGTY